MLTLRLTVFTAGSHSQRDSILQKDGMTIMSWQAKLSPRVSG